MKYFIHILIIIHLRGKHLVWLLSKKPTKPKPALCVCPIMYRTFSTALKTLVIFFAFLIMSGEVLGQSFAIVGSGTASNTSSGYPAPFGNWYHGARHQLFVTAAQLTAAGIPAGAQISSLGFNVTATNSAAIHNSYQVKVYTTTSTDPISSGWHTSGLVATSTAVNQTITTGWIQTGFTAFTWNGTDNLVIETCFQNTGYTNNASTQHTTTGLGTATWSRWYRADLAGVCGSTLSTGTSTTTRPNIRFGYTGTPGTSCHSNCTDCTDAACCDIVVANDSWCGSNWDYICQDAYDACVSSCATSTNFYSKSTGNLNVLSTWGTNTDGTGTAPCNFTSNNSTYHIRNNATPTIGAAWTVSGTGSKVVVGNGTNACTFTIPSSWAYSSVATDISNNATIINQNTNVTSLGTCIVLNGGTYEHNCNGGNVPTATWNTGSTCKITGIGNTGSFAGFNQTFHHYIWDCPSQVDFAWSIPEIINGNFTLNASNSAYGLIVSWGNGVRTSTVHGDFIINGGVVEILRGTGTGTGTLNVNGNFVISGGTFRNRHSSSSGTPNFNLKGNWTNNGGTYTPDTHTLTLNGTSLQTIGGTATTTFNNLTLNNAAGASLSRATNVGGTLTLTSGRLTTTTTNILHVTNQSTGAISGAATTRYISGPMRWTLATGSAYSFPVGKNNIYYPFALTPSGTTGMVVQVEAFNANCGGSAGTGLTSLSTTEYWQTSVFSGTFTTGVVGLTRQAALGTLDAIGRSTTQGGTYASLNGTVSGTSITGSDATGSSLGFFVMAVKTAACTAPTNPTASGTATICSGNSTNISATSTNATTIYWYTGSCGGTQVGTSNPGSNFSVSPGATTTYYARGYNSAGGGCWSAGCGSVTITVNNVPAQPSTITGSTSPNQGTSQNYSVTNVSGVTYTWAFPSGWTQTGGGTTNSITVTVGSGSGNITVTPSNACGNGTARTLAVSPLPLSTCFNTEIYSAPYNTWGTGTTNPQDPYNSYYTDSRASFIITASELSNSGLKAGNIESIKFYAYETTGRSTSQFSVRLKHVGTQTTFTAWDNSGWTLVYGPTNVQPTGGNWFEHQFTTSFAWNGTSNIAVDIYRDDDDYTSGGGLYVKTGMPLGKTFAGRDDNYGYNDWPGTMTGTQYSHVPAVQICGVEDTGSPGLWTGNTSTNWNTGSNWSDGNVPTSSVDVTIPTSPSGGRMPYIQSAVAECKNLTIQTGAVLSVSSDYYLYTYGSTITINGGVERLGGTTNYYCIFTGANCTISGSGYIHKFSPWVGTATLGSDFIIGISGTTDGELGIRNGNLNTSGYKLTIYGNLYMDDGTFNASSSSILLSGFWYNVGGTFTTGTSTVNFNGNTPQSIEGAQTFYNLHINNTSSFVVLFDEITVSNNLIISDNATLFDYGNQITGNSSGNLSLGNGASLFIGYEDVATATVFPTQYTQNNISLNHNSDVYYYANASPQYISTVPHYGHLILGTGASASSKQIQPLANLTVNGDFYILPNATFEAHNYTHTIGGNFVRNGGFNRGQSTINLTGTGKEIGGSTTIFRNLNIQGTYTVTAPGVQILQTSGAGGILDISGTLNLNGKQLTLGFSGSSAKSSVVVANGGTFQSTNSGALVTRGGTANYTFTVQSGGTLSAANTIFEYMDASGINLESGSILHTLYNFSNCTFRNGTSGGTLLTLANNYEGTINNAVFGLQSGEPAATNVNGGTRDKVVTFSGPGSNAGEIWGEYYDSELEGAAYNFINWTNGPAPTVSITGANGTGNGTAVSPAHGITHYYVSGTSINATGSGSNVSWSIPAHASPSSGCGSPASITLTGDATITWNASNISLTSALGTNNQNVCVNAPITNIIYSSTGATGANFTGLPPGVNGSYSNGNITISGTPTTANTYNYTVTLTGQGICGTVNATGTITVAGATTINSQSTAAQAICFGQTFNPISVSASGTTLSYQWYSNTTETNSGGTPISGATSNSYTPLSTTAGTLFYYCIVGGDCGTATSEVSGAFLVRPLPAVNSASNSSICSGAALNYNITSDITGATFNWSRAAVTGISNSVVSNQTSNPITETLTNTTSSPVNVIYQITPIANGCSGSEFTFTVTVNPATSITNQSTATHNVCINGSFSPLTVTASGIGLSYQWYSNTTPSTSGGTNLGSGNGAQTASYTPPATTAGTTYYYVVVTGSCGNETSAISGAMVVNPNNTITLTSAAGTNNQSLCAGTAITNITYSTTGATDASVSGLPAGVTGSWSGDVVTISGTPTADGTFDYTVTMSGGCTGGTNTATDTITVKPNPQINSAASGTVCSGTALNYTITADITGTSFSWSRAAVAGISNLAVSNQTTSSITETLTNTTSSPVNVIYLITPTADGCSGSEFTYTVTVNPLPTVFILEGSGAQCQPNQDLTLSGSQSGVSYQLQLNGSNTGSPISGTGNSLNFGLQTVEGNYTVVATNTSTNCQSVTAPYNLSTLPAAPDPITATAATDIACFSANANWNSSTYATNYFLDVSTNSGFTTYVTDYQNRDVGNNTSESITGLAANTTYYYRVRANNSCGISDYSNTITFSTLPTPAQPGIITGNNNPCPATSQTYSISSVSGATGYTWSVPTGWGITAGQGTVSITVTSGASGGNISVTANNACGSGTASTMAVSVQAGTPATPGTISGTVAQCPGLTGQTYSINSVTDATTYTWTVPVGWTITAGDNTTTITVTTGSAAQNGNITVTATNSCGTSAAQTLAVTVASDAPVQPGTITGTATQCPGLTNQTYSINSVTDAITYTWTVPTGWTITDGQNSTTITVTTGSAGQNGDITVTAGNSCGTSAAQSLAVTVLPNASIGEVIGTTSLCIGQTTTYTANAVVHGGGSGAWSSSNTAAATVNSSSGLVTAIAEGNTNIIYTITGGCGGTVSDQQSLSVSPDIPAGVSITANPSNNICQGESVTFTATPTNGGTAPSYQWKLNSTNVGINSSTYTSSSLSNGDIISVVMTSNAASQCLSNNPAASNEIIMNISSNLPVSVSISASETGLICFGTDVTFTAESINGGASPAYNWLVNGVSVGSNSNEFISNSLYNGDIVSVVLTSDALCTSGSPATSNVITMQVSNVSVNASLDQTVPRGVPVQLNGSVVDASGVIWTSDIPGIFTPNANTLNATWLPNDITYLGDAVLTLTTTGAAPCDDISDEMTVSLIIPTYCSGQNNGSATFNPGTGIGYDRFEVSIDGGATWIDYIPGTLINTTGATVSVQIKAFREYSGISCAGYDIFTLWYILDTDNLIVDAGSDLTICEVETTPALNGSVTGSSEAIWVSNSGGIFNNQNNAVTATWTPPVGFTGQAVLTLVVIGDCGSASDSRIVNVMPSVEINPFANSSSVKCQEAGLETYTTTANYATEITYSVSPPEAGTMNPNTGIMNWSASFAGPTATITATAQGCNGPDSTTHTVNITPVNTIALTSAANTNNQTVCLNTAIMPINYTTTGATNAIFSGLPIGINGSFDNQTGNITISGTPQQPGPYQYSVLLTGGCGTVSANGTIDVTPPNTIQLISSTNTPSGCQDQPMISIVYTTTGATDASVTGLPANIGWTFANNTLTISGTPLTSGSFNYTITISGGCDGTLVTASGTIYVCDCIDVNHNGANWTISSNTTVSGNHYNVGTFTVNSGVVVTVDAACHFFNVVAETINVIGTIGASGAGNSGGHGGYGGFWAFGNSSECWGGHGGTGGHAGAGIGGGGAGLSGSNAACLKQICGNFLCIGNRDGLLSGGGGGGGGAGGTYGGQGGIGAHGAVGSFFSGVPGGNYGPGGIPTSTYGTTDDTDISWGSGGGGGGGGGGGFYDGGNGGSGGSGGGMVSLYATETLSISGNIYADGVNGQAGADGGRTSFSNQYTCTATGYNSCTFCSERNFDAPGGAGGGGAGGAGGGIKIGACGSISITGVLRANGGKGGQAGLPNPSYGNCIGHAQGGAGGGGGRIKISGNPCLTNTITTTIYTEGGSGGVAYFNNGYMGNNGSVVTDMIHPGCPQVNAGTIADNQSICLGASPLPFMQTSAPSGGTGSYSFQWQQQINCTGNWTNITGATASTYQALSLSQTTCFRREVTSGTSACGPSYTNVVSVVVIDLPDAPILTNPANNANVQPGTTVTFNWNTISGATSYTFNYSLNSGASWISHTTSSNTYSLALPEYGDNSSAWCGTHIQWRVSAKINTCEGPSSNIKNLYIYPKYNNAPAVLLTPTASCQTYSSSIVQGGAAYFRFVAVENATYYFGTASQYDDGRLDCGTTTAWDTYLRIYRVDENCTLTASDDDGSVEDVYGCSFISWTATTAGTYYIQLIGKTNSDYGTYHFQYRTCTTPGPVNNLEIIGTTSTGVTFEWEAPDNPAGTPTVSYWWYISEIANPIDMQIPYPSPSGSGYVCRCGSSGILIGNTATPGTECVATENMPCCLKPNTQYYVHMYAMSECNWVRSPWTSVGFTTLGREIVLTSANNVQTLCENEAITPITYTTTGLSSIPEFLNLPAGIYGNYDSLTGNITISGTPNESGSFIFYIVDCDTIAQGSINVNTAPTNVSAGNDVSICDGENTQLNATADVVTTVAYAWSSNPSGFTSNLQNPVVSPSITTTYAVTVTVDGCTATDEVVVTVNPSIVASVEIEANPAGTVCSGTEITFSATPTNGGSLPVYQWQVNDNTVGTNSYTFISSNLVDSDEVKVILTSSEQSACLIGSPATSNTIEIDIFPGLFPGTIGSDQSIDYNTTPAQFTEINPASGGTGTYAYQWQMQEKCVGTWTDITNANFVNYQANNLTDTTCFRRYVESDGAPACGSYYTNVIKVVVYPPLIPGVIAEEQTICYNTAPDEFSGTMPTMGGAGSYTYQWQKQENCTGNWSNISGATGLTYQAPPLNITTCFRREDKSVTQMVYTNVITVFVTQAALTPSAVIGPDEICAGDTITLTVDLTPPMPSCPAIGDLFEGGIVAYILQPGDHGYIAGECMGIVAASNDINQASWGCTGAYITGTLPDIGFGHINTNEIVYNCFETFFAAKFCDELSLNGFTDWYLPSKDELNKLYENLYQQGLGNFAPDAFYWTSTQYSTNEAWRQHFSSTTQQNDWDKSANLNIRAVRFFHLSDSVSSNMLTDIDNNTYNTVQIGNQIWMTENLKTTKYRDGSLINYPGISDTAWQSNASGAYAWYNNYEANYKDTYGALYNWHAVNNPAGLCPYGWRIPTENEWFIMENHIDDNITDPAAIGWRGVNAGTQLKASTPDWDGNNITEFYALPGGNRTNNGVYEQMGSRTIYWAKTENTINPQEAWYRILLTGSTGVYRSSIDKKSGLSVRCIKDAPPITTDYVWFSDSCGTTPIANGISIDVAPTSTTTYFVRAEGECNTSDCISHTITIKPNNTIDLTSATGSNNQSLCVGTSVDNIIYETTGAISATVSGLSVGIIGTWTTDMFVISGTPTETGTFNFEIELEGGCGNISELGTINVSEAPLINVQPVDGAVCLGDPHTFTSSVSGTSLSYTWEFNNAGTWSTVINNIPAGANYSGNNGSNLNIIGINTSGTYSYRYKVDALGCETTSDTVELEIFEELLDGGTIEGETEICFNTSPDEFQIVDNPAGSTGSFTYQWEKDVNCDGNWVIISGATGATLDYSDSLSSNTCFRRKAISCGSAYSNTVIVSIKTGHEWEGIDNDWFKDENWQCGQVPNEFIDAIITLGADFYPIIETQSSKGQKAECLDLLMDETTSLTLRPGEELHIFGEARIAGEFEIGGDAEVKIEGDFIIEPTGSFDATTGKVSFIGSGDKEIVRSNENLRFYDLVINTENNTDKVILAVKDSLIVRNTLILDKGGLKLNDRILIIDNPDPQAITSSSKSGQGYILSETKSAPEPGAFELVQWNVGDAINEYTVPYARDDDGTIDDIPLTLQILANTMDSEEGFVRFSTYGTDNNEKEPYPSVIGQGNIGHYLLPQYVYAYVYNRYWYIEHNNDASAFIEGKLSMTFITDENPDGNVVDYSMMAVRYNPNVSTHGSWTDVVYTQQVNAYIPVVGGAVLDQNNNTFTTGYITKSQFHNVWLLTNYGTPLPITLLNFDANCLNNKVNVFWSTATEINNHYFTIERCSDGINWYEVNKIQGYGTVSTQSNYSFIDYEPLEVISYYRLSQTDFDGTIEYFNPIVVNCPQFKQENVFVYPNPFSNTITVEFINMSSGNAVIKIFDALGKTVMSKSNINIDEGNGKVMLDLSTLADGIYYIQFLSDEFVKVERITKQK